MPCFYPSFFQYPLIGLGSVLGGQTNKYAYEVALTMKNEFKNLGIKSDMISYPYTRLILDANRTKKNKGFYSKLSTYLTPNELKKIELEYDKYVKNANL